VINKEEFAEWKRSKITQAVFNVIKEKIEELKERLVSEVAHATGGQTTSGAILAFKEILDIDFEETQ
jgi:hypothetical protein